MALIPGYKFTCTSCNRTGLLEHEVSFSNGRIRSCKDCYNAYGRTRNKNRHKRLDVKEWHKYNHILKTYNLSKSDYYKKLELQLNGCAICKQEFSEIRKVGIDHNHKTGIVRDLLCYKCNNILGQLNDDENYIWNILEYLKRHSVKVA